MIIKIKPISVNVVWQGRRWKTPAYKKYEEDVLGLLPEDLQIPDGPLQLFLTFGMSSKQSDWDNPIKPFQDVLQKKYNFNDNRVYHAIIWKKIVPKGEEYIQFELLPYEVQE